MPDQVKLVQERLCCSVVGVYRRLTMKVGSSSILCKISGIRKWSVWLSAKEWEEMALSETVRKNTMLNIVFDGETQN